MAERIRTVSIHVEIDTNKRTYKKTFDLVDDETTDELIARAKAWADAVMEQF